MTTAAPARPAGGEARGHGCPVGFVGLGYAGLPQALAFAAAGHPVLGVDIDEGVVAALGRGASPVDTVGESQLRAVDGLFRATTSPDGLAACSAIVVCVPTPVDADNRPDLTALRQAVTAVARRLVPGQLVVVESTVHPGTTDTVVKPILEARGLVAGVHFNLAFAPERVDPGNPVFGPANTPKVVGGYTSVCARRAAELYRGAVHEVHLTTGLREAEAAKILENTYRQVNLALAHEFAAYCDAQGIDTIAAVEAAATKPFGFEPFYPGVGVGGHCIPVDPLYLASAARELGSPMRMVELAHEVNAARPGQVAQRCRAMLAAAGVPIEGAGVLVLGLTYKPDVADLRNTPVAGLVRSLRELGADVSVHDPFVPAFEVDGVSYPVVADLDLAVKTATLVVIAQPHTGYRSLRLHEANLVLQAAHRVGLR